MRAGLGGSGAVDRPVLVRRGGGHVAELTDATWQRADVGRGPGGWVEVDDDGARKTRVVDGACVFLNDPAFAGGAGCALHHLAAALAVDALHTKPDVCWQLPLRRTYRTVTRPDTTTYLEVQIAEYDRRAWGPGGHDLDWYCTGNPLAHIGAEPVYVSLAAELIELVGAAAYAEIARQGAELRDARRPLPVTIHPATRIAGDVGDRG